MPGWILSTEDDGRVVYVRFRVVQPAPDQSFESWDHVADRDQAHRFPTRQEAEDYDALWPCYRFEQDGERLAETGFLKFMRPGC